MDSNHTAKKLKAWQRLESHSLYSTAKVAGVTEAKKLCVLSLPKMALMVIACHHGFQYETTRSGSYGKGGVMGIGLHNVKIIYNGHASIHRASMKVDAFYLSTAFYSLSPCPVFSKSYGESLIGNAVGEFSLFGSDRRYLLIRLCGLCISERKVNARGEKVEVTCWIWVDI